MPYSIPQSFKKMDRLAQVAASLVMGLGVLLVVMVWARFLLQILQKKEVVALLLLRF